MSTRVDVEVGTARARLLEGIAVAERRIEAAGVETAVLQGGEGPPVVLLHGPGGNAAHWARVLPALLATHRVVAPDLPGQGESGVPGEPLDAARVLAWVDELIAATCDSPPVLVGYALGGAIAARFASERGDRLARLVLVDALGLAPFAPAPEFGQALQTFVAQPGTDTHEGLWQRCALDLDRLRGEMGERWEAFEAYNVDRARTPSVMAAMGALMDAFALRPVPADELGRIDVPTALVWGRHDLATPLAAAQDVAARHGWPLQVIEDCADDPPVEQPEAFLRALRPALGVRDDAVQALRERASGAVLRPQDDGFADATRLWNAMVRRTPALVVRARGAGDVVAAMDLAAREGLPLSVRGGGHNIAGTSLADGGVTIDMSQLRDVSVDPQARTAVVQPGCLLGDVDRATQRHGLATPLGFVSEVGVAGLTLGGGLGYLSRRFGWTVDNLLEVEIVTPDGRIRRASRDEHADLFWGVRGAGANLGVVTSFTFRLHEVGPMVHGGLVAWPFERAPEILRAYRTIATQAPRELTVFLVLLRAPAAPFVPPAWHGERICAMAVCHSGDPERADEALAPIRALGEPIFDLVQEQPYVEVQSYLDVTEPKGLHYYWKTEYLPGLTDELLATVQDAFAACPVPGADIGILHLGGAVADRADDDGAVGNRDARFACGVKGMWEPGEPRADSFRQWVRDAGERVRPFSTGASYVNFQTADEDEERVRATYGPNHARLVELKRRYDPGNVLRSNRNIRPG